MESANGNVKRVDIILLKELSKDSNLPQIFLFA